MIQTVLFIILSLVSVIALLGIALILTLLLISRIRKKQKPWLKSSLKKASVFLLIAVLLNFSLVILSQFFASTPDIVDSKGREIENSISELRKIKLNGRTQWISIRGHDKNAPILLFLAGGPGGTQMAAVRHDLKELEKHFVVVNWDQPGSGKSFYAEKTKNITVKTYIEDGGALTEYLKERFSKDKIYLMGESWGSALGIFLIDRYPQSYHAFIGTGQMVDFEETERIDYNKALEIAKSRGENGIVKKLLKNGEPPYYGKGVTWKSAVYLNYLSRYMAENSDIHNPGYNTFRDIFSSEYGLIDKVNYLRGIVTTYNHVYQQLYTTDLRKDYDKLSVPVYFFLGRHDVNAPTELAEEYYNVLEAPDKKIVWFEHSGHSPWINESDKFVREVLECFTQKKAD